MGFKNSRRNIKVPPKGALTIREKQARCLCMYNKIFKLGSYLNGYICLSASLSFQYRLVLEDKSIVQLSFNEVNMDFYSQSLEKVFTQWFVE